MKINGTEIKTPSSMTLTISDIDGDSYRNALGETIRDRIAVKRKIELEWKTLSSAEISKLLTAVKNTFFSVSYLDAVTGTTITKTFYVGDRTAPVYSLVDGKERWTNLKMNFIEK